MKFFNYLLSSCLLISVACSNKKILTDENVTVTKSDIINLRMNWLKDKDEKFDLEMTVTNVSEKDVIIMLNDISCAKGTAHGRLKHTFFNTGERTIDFRAGESKLLRMVCVIGVELDGDFKISINRIYENPNADGATKGKALGEKVDWSGRL